MAHCLDTLRELNENDKDDKEEDCEFRNDLGGGQRRMYDKGRISSIHYDFDNEKTEENSAHLSHLMNLVVGTPDMIWYRQEFCRMYDHILYEGDTQWRVYFTGSKAEGLDLPGSDKDFMLVDPDIVITQEPQKGESSQSKSPLTCLLLMKSDYDRPCFTILQCSDSFLSERVYFSSQFVGNEMYLSSYLYMLNLNNHSPASFRHVIQGPSLETHDEYSHEGTDCVYCLQCNFWPPQASEWLNRHRPACWPSDHLIEKIRRKGCHLVAVGHPLSDNKEMEWRLSFSLAERELVWSFNHIQMQCYAFLKTFLKQYIKPRMKENILCSYFMKTLMFWEIESQPSSFWTSWNLINCFTHLLRKLHDHVVTGHLSHYFIPEFNLFEIKVKGKEQTILVDILCTVINFDMVGILAKCESFRLVVELFWEPSSSKQQIMQVVESDLCINSIACKMFWNVLLRSSLPAVSRRLLTIVYSSNNVYFYETREYLILEAIKKVLSHGHHCQHKLTYNFYRLLSSKSRSNNVLVRGIWKATWLLHVRNFSKSLITINFVASAIPEYYFYHSGNKLQNRREQLYKCIDLSKTDSTLSRKYQRFWMFDLQFLGRDFSIVPAAIQVELVNGDYTVSVYVSPFVYLYYLQFLCFHGLHDYANRDRSLHQLIETANSEEQGGHLIARYHSYNIAGHCLWFVKRYSESRNMFVKSVYTTEGTPFDKYNSAWNYLNMV